MSLNFVSGKLSLFYFDPTDSITECLSVEPVLRFGITAENKTHKNQWPYMQETDNKLMNKKVQTMSDGMHAMEKKQER